jgi:hypothetical protein
MEKRKPTLVGVSVAVIVDSDAFALRILAKSTLNDGVSM